jgi:two-component system OmpR family response regulator
MPDESPAAPGLRILVVDDNHDAAESFAALLQLLGHRTTVAHDGPAALRAATAEPPDCAFLDISLPGMDGYELARRLRNEPGLRRLKLIAYSAYSDARHAERAMAAGFDFRLTKAADPAELEGLLMMLDKIKDLAETTEQLARQNVALAGQTKDLLREVKEDLKEVKQDMKELKDEIREIRDQKDPPDPKDG